MTWSSEYLIISYSYSQKYEVNNETYERCMSAYHQTLVGGKFERGRSVWIDGPGVEVICSLLNPQMEVLEFGTGGSTSLFSQFVRRWDSVEHNSWWAAKVREMLGSEERVNIYTVPNDRPYKEGAEDGSEAQFHHYLNYPETLGRKYDLILNDGRARLEVGRSVLRQRLLASNSSLLIVHDWERLGYKDIVNKLGYRILLEDKESRRHLACLLPPQDYKAESKDDILLS